MGENIADLQQKDTIDNIKRKSTEKRQTKAKTDTKLTTGKTAARADRKHSAVSGRKRQLTEKTSNIYRDSVCSLSLYLNISIDLSLIIVSLGQDFLFFRCNPPKTSTPP